MARVGTISVVPGDSPDSTDVTSAPPADQPDYNSMSDEDLQANFNKLNTVKEKGVPGSNPIYGNVGAPPVQPDYGSMSDEELQAMHKNLSELTAGTERAAQHEQDIALTGGKDTQSQALAASIANSATFNVARNAKALYDAYKYGSTFKDEYAREKAYDEALARLNPGTTAAGDITGGIAQIPFTPGFGGIGTGIKAVEALPGFIKSAIPHALTSGAYGALSGGIGEHSLSGAGREGLTSAITGSILGPTINKALSIAASRSLYRPVDSAGNFTPMAQDAIRKAGIVNPPPELKQKLIDTFQIKGISPAAAREAGAGEFGVNLTRAQTEANPQGIYRESKLPAPAGGDIEQFKGTQKEAAQIGAREQLIPPELSQHGSEFESPAVTKSDIQSAYRASQATKNAAYADPDIDRGFFDKNAIARIADNVDQKMAADPTINATVNNPKLTQTRAAIKTLEDFSALRQQSLFGSNVNPQNIVGVNMRYIEETRKMLGELARDAEPKSTDLRNVSRMMDHFDDEVDSAGVRSTFSGGPEAVRAMEVARAANRDYKQKFGVQGPGDKVGKIMQEIVHDNLSPKDIADHFFNTTTVGGKGTAASLYNRMADALGRNSPEMNSVKNTLKQKLIGPKPERFDNFSVQARQIATRIEEFVNKSGSDLAKTAFSPAERSELLRYASVLRNASRPGSADIDANQKGFVNNLFSKTAKWVAAGAALHFLGEGPAGAALSFAVHKGVEKATDKIEANKIAKATKTMLSGAPTVKTIPKVGFHNRPATITPGIAGPLSGVSAPMAGVAGAAGSYLYNRYGPAQRAKGGRVEADRLGREAERANKSLGGALKPLMNMPDETIAHALRLANE